MEIELKNGERLILEITPLILEYIEDYQGGIEQLKKDALGEKDKNGYTKTMYATNHLLYSMIASNYDTYLTYKQAVRLVKLEDVDKIVTFAKENIPEINQESKEEHRHRI